MDIKGGEIRAKVQGRRLHPYEVFIGFRPFSAAEKRRIRDIIEQSPSLATRLSLGELPEALLDELEAAGIRLFPRDWDDLRRRCSCPDWADPCKHLAAVYYILANEIDKDPFLVFGLRGMDAEELGAASGLSVEDVGIGDAREELPFVPLTEATVRLPEETGEIPGLSLAPVEPRTLLSPLASSPLFWGKGDFKDLLLSAYRLVRQSVRETGLVEEMPRLRYVDLRLVFDAAEKEEPSFFVSWLSPQSSVSRLEYALRGSLPEGSLLREARLKVPDFHGERPVLMTRRGFAVRVEDLLPLLMSLSPKAAARDLRSPSFRYFVTLTSVGMAFAGAGAFFPRVVPAEGHDFRVVYRPFMRGREEEEICAHLGRTMPVEAAFRSPDGRVLSAEGAEELLSLLITRMVWFFCRGRDWSYGDRMAQVFFRGRLFRAARFEERRTRMSVANWLAALSPAMTGLTLQLRVEPAGEDDVFRLGLELADRHEPVIAPVPWAEVCSSSGTVLGRPAEKVRMEAARRLALASEYLPPLSRLLDSRGKEKPELDGGELARLLTGTAGILEIMGIRIALPRELRDLARPRPALRAELRALPAEATYLSLSSLLEFEWRVALGELEISVEDFRRLASRATGVVRFRDRYILLSPGEAQALLKRLLEPPPQPSPLEVVQWSMLGEAEGGSLFRPGRELKKLLKSIGKPAEIEMPASLRAELRPYQVRGVRWLYANTSRGFGACLADDMGLGKTVQSLALLLILKEEGRLKRPALVVCPTTVLGNWLKETERFAPTLRTHVYYGTERQLKSKGSDLVITTYGTLRRDMRVFADRRWGALIIDEAQNIKNPLTGQARAVKALTSPIRLALSGTPLENRLLELWSIFEFLNPGYLGSRREFQRRYAVPIERFRDRERTRRLQAAISPFVMRRLKTDRAVIRDLPDKVVIDEFCRLTPAQASLYQQVVEKAMESIEGSRGMERRGLVLRLILFLKQICNHPAHFTGRERASPDASGKSQRLVELMGRILEAKEKVLVFTQFKEMGDLLCGMIEAELGEEPLFLHGKVPRARRDRMVEEFQENEYRPIMVLSLKAGGTGLNLTAASNVIHYDLWWNPAVEDQATDRAYRIGQKHNVMVHRLLCLDTFEEKIDAMIKSKRELAEITVRAGETWITELSDSELRDIFRLGGS